MFLSVFDDLDLIRKRNNDIALRDPAGDPPGPARLPTLLKESIDKAILEIRMTF